LERFKRTESLIGEDLVKKLNNSSVAVFGLGGVGGYVVEALARAGVGKIALIDNDTVAESNINRQIIATYKTVGKLKTEAFKDRLLDINPDIKIDVFNLFYLKDTADQIDLKNYDYVVDAIDTVSGKCEVIFRAKSLGIPVISCMGTGNKLDATLFTVADIGKTTYCPLAKSVRRQLKSMGIESGVKAVFSKEEPKSIGTGCDFKGKGYAPSSISYVPGVAGLITAGEVIKDLIGIN
jgi:tRNA A37 threonylcarbamoyladenosine dehydratase